MSRRCLCAAATVAAGFAAHGTFAPAARAAPAQMVSPAAAATYPAGGVGRAAPVATDASASVSAGADPAQYHAPQRSQYHANTGISPTPVVRRANIRADSPRPTPVLRRPPARPLAAHAAPVRATMRQLLPQTRAGAAGIPALTAAWVRVSPRAIAVSQSLRISVSRSRRSVVSTFGTGAGFVVNTHQIGHPIVSQRPLENKRAMMQLGMLFGLGYLGFLAIWFWSTRLRSKARWPLRL